MDIFSAGRLFRVESVAQDVFLGLLDVEVLLVLEEAHLKLCRILNFRVGLHRGVGVSTDEF